LKVVFDSEGFHHNNEMRREAKAWLLEWYNDAQLREPRSWLQQLRVMCASCFYSPPPHRRPENLGSAPIP
jgi:hypothetical protein